MSSFFVVSEQFVESCGYVVHHNIKVDLLRVLLALRKEVIMDLDVVGVVELDNNRKFAVSVFGVLENLLNSDLSPILDAVGLVNSPEGALADHLDPIVVSTTVAHH